MGQAIFRIFSELYYIITSAIQRFFRRISDLKSKYWWLIGGLIVIAIWEGGKYIYDNKIREQIVVYPNSINLTTKDWDVSKVFEIKNRHPKHVFFSIWVKLNAKDARLDFNNLQVTTGDDEAFVSADVGDVSISFDALQFQGLDSEGKPCIYLVLYSLENSKPKLFKVKKRHSLQNAKESISLRLEVKRFSTNPAEVLSETNRASLAIQFPENFMLQSFAILSKKKSDLR